MTPQEQYPKFYDHPERYLGIRVELLKDYNSGSKMYRIGTSFELTHYNYGQIMGSIQNWKPKFKPQQGEQFIKDLEDAVSCGIKDKSEFWEDTRVSKVLDTSIWYELRLKTSNFWVEVKVTVINLSEVIVSGMLLNSADTLGAYCFDTAAYVDRMRKLGYYL